MIMYFPYLLFGLLILMSLITDFDQRLNLIRGWLVAFFVLILALLAGLRDPTSTADTGDYVKVFNQVPPLNQWLTGVWHYHYQQFQMEIGYVGLNSFVKLLTGQPVFLFLLIALLAVGINIYHYYKYSPYVFLSILLYFSFTFFARDMQQIRAGLACAICLFIIPYLAKRQTMRACGVVLVAGCFHLAAFAMLIPIFVSRLWRLTPQRIIWIMSISVVIGLVSNTFVELLINHLLNLGTLTDKVVHYYHYPRYAKSLGVLDITNIKYIIFVALLTWQWSRLKSRIIHFEAMMWLYTLAGAWRITFSSVSIIAGRISTFFGIVEVILLPALILCFREKRLVWFGLVIYAGLMFWLYVMRSGFFHPSYGIV